MKKMLLVLLALALTSCGLGKPAFQIKPTPFNQIDVAALLSQPEGLPAGFSVQSEPVEFPNYLQLVPVSASEAFKAFQHEKKLAGGVGGFIYETKNEAERAYSGLTESFDEKAKTILDIGDQAMAESYSASSSRIQIELVDILFRRCNAVFYARFAGITDIEAARTYAKALDQRMAPYVCR